MICPVCGAIVKGGGAETSPYFKCKALIDMDHEKQP